MPRPLSLTLAALCLFAQAAPAAHPVVPGFERFPNAGGGQLLLTELNCVSCHVPKDAGLARKQAPVLDNVAGRVKVGFLRKFLLSPHATKPGTAMPDLFAGDPQRAQKVEALVHFLASTGSLKQERPDLKAVAAGRKHYAEIGCVACHGTRDAAGNPEKVTAATVPLPDLKTKYSISSLAAFLENPHHARPAGRMPKLVKDGKEAKELANYLLQGLRVDLATGPGTTQFAYYEGDFDRVPDFTKLKPKLTGQSPAFDVSAAQRGSNYALRFDGFFRVDRGGEYRFSVGSDDGSILSVDGKKVVDNDGVHAPKWASGSVKLGQGVHKVSVGFFQGGGGAEIETLIEGPGLGQQTLAPLTAATEAGLVKKPAPVKKDDPDAIDVQPALVAKGKELFASAGCASCHQMKADNKVLASSLKAPTLDQLKGSGGCLADAPLAGVPSYQLSPTQRTALAAAVKSPAPPRQDPKELVARTLATFNCYACHERDKLGGPEEELNKFFVTTQPEMGDEGRVPPPLNLVGAKLNPDYLKQILDRGSDDRPYMHTRMPGFGHANVGHLVEAFASLDKLPAVAEVKFNELPPKVKAAGRHLVGDNALGCIKCHTFAGHKAEGVQGIDMTLMPKRVQRDWFHAYLVDPQKVRPGTRMPTAWPGGVSVLPKVLGGKTDAQVESIWTYLKDGGQLPIGTRKQSIPLVPEKNAIVYRGFIEGSGPRAIAVGYPEKVSLTFDANDGRLSMLWQGAFIDAARHWTDRGSGFEPPLGDNVLKLPVGPAFAVLGKADAPWPSDAKKAGFVFRGYKLTKDDRPTFLYTVGDVRVEDFPNAGKESSLHRELTFTGAGENLYFRAAAGSKIEPAEDGWFRVDGWKMKLEGGETPRVRQSGGKAELLVPVPLSGGKGRLVQEIVW